LQLKSGGGWLQAAAALLSGGGGSPAGSPEMPKRRYGALINRVKTPKYRGEAGGFTGLLEGEEEAAVEWIGDEVRPVYSCSGGLPWGSGVEEEKSSRAVRGGEVLGGGFYRWRGAGRRRGQGGGRRARRRPPLRPVGSVRSRFTERKGRGGLRR
jgi:hypothetical protein